MHVGLRNGDPLDRRLYGIWRKMHFRCESEAHPHYHRYGGRGIKVCEEWNSLIVFGKWALENGYAPELTLDRIDNDGDYEPSNCRWATHKEQMNNTSRSIPVVLDEKLAVKKSFSVRQRNKRWEYRIDARKDNGQRRQISKCGFATKEAAIKAAQEFIKENTYTTF